MYEQQKDFKEFVAARPMSRVEKYADTLECPILRIDGTIDYRESANYIASQYLQLTGENFLTPESQGISSDSIIELVVFRRSGGRFS